MDWTQIILAVLAIIGSIVTGLLIPFLRTRVEAMKSDMSTQQREKFDYWLNLFVAAAESVYKGIGSGALKKQWVIDQLKGMGLDFDETAVSLAIEGMVQKMTASGEVNNNPIDTAIY